MDEFFGIFFANFTACAIACDDSSAGIIPSVFVKSKNAFTASLSVAAACCIFPFSFDKMLHCVGGGSNAIGTFYPLVTKKTKLFGIEAAGTGLSSGMHSASLTAGKTGVLHGMMTYLLQDSQGQIKEAHSISAGLDYPGVGPEHANLKDTGRVLYAAATDKEAVNAFLLLTKTEGIIPALESSHAIAHAVKLAKKMPKKSSIVVTLSGRGDKDMQIVESYLARGAKKRV